MLDEVKTKITIDEKLLVDSFFRKYSKEKDDILMPNGFEKEIAIISKKALFATENPSILFVDFNIDCSCIDIIDKDRINATLRTHGDGKYNSNTKSFEEIRCEGFELNYFLPDGTEKIHRSVFLNMGSISFGTRLITHTVKYELK